jgi:hypothetical protein
MFMLEITRIRSTLAASIVVASVALGGCAEMSRVDSEALARERAAEIESQRAELAREKEALERERAQFEAERLAEAERDNAETAAEEMEALAANGGSDNRPPNAKPGECYARVLRPAVFETTNERVLKKEASQRIEIIPPRYETVEESVEIKPATIKLEVVPAVYTTVEEQVLVKPAVTETREVPAVFRTVTETKEISPQRSEWQRVSEIDAGGNILDTRVGSTGELMCLVEIPASYETFERQELVEPATTITVEVEPPVYRMVEKTVLVTPEMTREVPIAPVYRTVSVTRLVEEAQELSIDVPAEWETVTSSTKVRDEKFEWHSVLCKVNMTREHVSEIQTALNETGCCQCGPRRNACEVDGIMGPCTLRAAQCFATREDMAWGSNFITMEVIKALGLEL